MEKTYSINLFDGHLIFAEEGRQILLDTGSPLSLSRDGEVVIMGMTHQCSRRLPMYGGPDEFSKLIGYDIDVLLGLDILRDYKVKIDYAARELTISDTAFDTEGYSRVPLSLRIYYLLPMTVNGSPHTFALDTGARISYIHAKETSQLQPIDEREDFNPEVGRFTTPIFQMSATVAQHTFPVQFGNAPSRLATALGLFGIEGIIGYDLFAAFTVILDLSASRLYLK